jgi:hypothetical protein
LIDVHVDDAPDLQGASCTTGGLFCGKAHGNVFNHGDGKGVLESDVGTMPGRLKLYRAGEDPTINKPQMTLKVKYFDEI